MAAPQIPLNPLDSSSLSAFGYDPVGRRLAVKFRSGAIYHYQDVTPELHAALAAADSPGGFFASQIRGKFQVERMTGTCPACGAQHGWIGESCADCGCATYAAV